MDDNVAFRWSVGGEHVRCEESLCFLYFADSPDFSRIVPTMQDTCPTLVATLSYSSYYSNLETRRNWQVARQRSMLGFTWVLPIL
jgi:hypothetical protein